MAKLYSSRVKLCLMSGVSPHEWDKQLSMGAQMEGVTIIKALGLHPWHVSKESHDNLETQIEYLESLLIKKNPIYAIGELGLDYIHARSGEDRKKQLIFCEKQLQLASYHKLPVVIHNVKAHHDMIPLLKRYHEHLPGIVMHSFIGRGEALQAYVKMGCYISLSPRSMKSLKKEALDLIPIAQILIESDMPESTSLAKDFRKMAEFEEALNQHSLDKNPQLTAQDQVLALDSVAKKLATIKGEDENHIWQMVNKNISKLLRLNS